MPARRSTAWLITFQVPTFGSLCAGRSEIACRGLWKGNPAKRPSVNTFADRFAPAWLAFSALYDGRITQHLTMTILRRSFSWKSYTATWALKWICGAAHCALCVRASSPPPLSAKLIYWKLTSKGEKGTLFLLRHQCVAGGVRAGSPERNEVNEGGKERLEGGINRWNNLFLSRTIS